MSSRNRNWAILLLLPFLAALIPLLRPTPVDSAPVSSDGWELQSSVPKGKTLYGIWGTSPSDVFAVGESGTILHYNGTTWTSMASPTTQTLYDICGSSSTNVYAVGECGTFLHYNGSSWTSITYADPSYGTPPCLRAIWVSASGEVKAVGDNFTLNYSNSGWDYGSIGYLYYNDIWGSSSSDLIAVGNNGAIVCFASQRSTYSASNLYGIWGNSRTDAFAVGANGTLLHYNGSAWSSMKSGSSQQLNGVWGSSSDNVYAVGAQGTLLHYNGSTWSPMASGVTNPLHDIWGCSASDIFIVGEKSTILRYSESTLPTPVITSVDPGRGTQGQTLEVTITGTDLNAVTAVSLGEGIRVNSFTVDSPDQITANITLDLYAPSGTRELSASTGKRTGTLPDGFTVGETILTSPWVWAAIDGGVIIMGGLAILLMRRRSSRQTPL